MKPRVLRAFLEEFIAHRGGHTERHGDHRVILRWSDADAEILGGSELDLAFSLRGLQENPQSELGTVGNPRFDRVLDLARRDGRAGVRYRPAGRPAGRGPDPAAHYGPEGLAFGPAIATYAPLYFFLFRAQYSLEDQADELEVAPVDGTSLSTLGQTPELVELWQSLESAPARGREVRSPFPIRATILSAAVSVLEKRLRKRLGRVRRDSDEHLRRETENIEGYYRQLIEESRNTGRRWALTAAQREERIRLLQLDWKRRIEEARENWRPRIDVRLVAAAAVMQPRTAFPLLAPAGRKGPGNRSESMAFVEWDEDEGRFVDPACTRCGTLGPFALAVGVEGILCPNCAGVEKQKPDRRQGEEGSR